MLRCHPDLLQCWEAAVNVASQHLPGQLRTVVASVAHKLQEVERHDTAAKLLKVCPPPFFWWSTFYAQQSVHSTHGVHMCFLCVVQMCSPNTLLLLYVVSESNTPCFFFCLWPRCVIVLAKGRWGPSRGSQGAHCSWAI